MAEKTVFQQIKHIDVLLQGGPIFLPCRPKPRSKIFVGKKFKKIQKNSKKFKKIQKKIKLFPKVSEHSLGFVWINVLIWVCILVVYVCFQNPLVVAACLRWCKTSFNGRLYTIFFKTYVSLCVKKLLANEWMNERIYLDSNYRTHATFIINKSL